MMNGHCTRTGCGVDCHGFRDEYIFHGEYVPMVL